MSVDRFRLETRMTRNAQAQDIIKARYSSLPPRWVAGTLVGCWPAFLLILHVALTGGAVSAPWMMGWIAVLSACALGSYALTKSDGFDVQQLELAGVLALAYPLFVMTGVPDVTQRHFGSAGADRLPLATVAAYACVLAGARVVNTAGRATRSRRVMKTSLIQRVVVALWIVAGFGVLGFYISYAGTPPLVDLLNGTRGSALAVARQNALVDLSNPLVAYAFNFVRLYFLPVASAALVVHWTRVRTLASGAAALGLLGVALIAAALTLEKSPVMRLAVIVGLAFALGSGVRVRLGWSVLVVFGSACFPLLVLSASNPGSSLGEVLRLFADRIFIDPARVIFFYLDWAPKDSGGFLGGRLLPFVGRHAGPSVPVTQIISSRIFPTATVQGNANVAFLGSFWVDFGWWGVIFGSLFTGGALACIQRVLDAMRGSVLGVAVAALFVVQVAFLTLTSVFDSVLSVGFGVIDVLALTYWWVRILGATPPRTTAGRGRSISTESRWAGARPDVAAPSVIAPTSTDQP